MLSFSFFCKALSCSECPVFIIVQSWVCGFMSLPYLGPFLSVNGVSFFVKLLAFMICFFSGLSSVTYKKMPSSLFLLYKNFFLQLVLCSYLVEDAVICAYYFKTSFFIEQGLNICFVSPRRKRMESLQSCLKFIFYKNQSLHLQWGEFHDFPVHAVLKKDHCSEIELLVNQ